VAEGFTRIREYARNAKIKTPGAQRQSNDDCAFGAKPFSAAFA